MAIHGVRVELPPTSAAPRLARQIILDMNPPAAVLDDMLLVVSELVTNAVEHGAPPVGMTVSGSSHGVTVEVYDAAGGEPRVRTLERLDAAGGGRGLRLVSEIAADWGVRADGQGKGVWAAFACPTSSATPWTMLPPGTPDAPVPAHRVG